jgi:hypothetical protein
MFCAVMADGRRRVMRAKNTVTLRPGDWVEVAKIDMTGS